MPSLRIILNEGGKIISVNNYVGEIDYDEDIKDATFNKLIADRWLKNNKPVVVIEINGEFDYVLL